jgi:hypothetical protein
MLICANSGPIRDPVSGLASEHSRQFRGCYVLPILPNACVTLPTSDHLPMMRDGHIHFLAEQTHWTPPLHSTTKTSPHPT